MKLKLILEFISYRIRRPHRNGHGIHSPFLFALVLNVLYKKSSATNAVSHILNVRKRMLSNNEALVIEDFGAGSTRISTRERKISDIARYSSISPKYGQLMYDLVTYLKPKTIIELGTGLGLGTMYMASAYEDTKVFTIEGSKSLLNKANENYSSLNFSNIMTRQGNFDDVLPVLLKEIDKFDLMFIDGNHTKEATIRYFELCLPHVKNNSVIIFDDIRWSAEMQQAWLEICRNKNVRISLDLFKLGIVFFNEKIIKQRFELYY